MTDHILQETAPVSASWGRIIRPFRLVAMRPLTKDWSHIAATDPAAIQNWWARWAQVNLGLSIHAYPTEGGRVPSHGVWPATAMFDRTAFDWHVAHLLIPT